MPILEIENLTFKYPGSGSFILENINLSIEEKDFIGIIGGNGSGKSTLLKLILGLYSPVSGKVLLWGKTPSQATPKVGYLSQYEDIDFNFPLTAFELVRMGTLKGKIVNKYTSLDNSLVKEKMEMLGIWEIKDRLIGKASGGQKQRCFLARALVSNSELLILDEPLANLDIKVQEDFFELLKKLNKDMTIIAVDHNLEILSRYSNKIICIDKCEPNSLKLHKGDLSKLVSINGNS